MLMLMFICTQKMEINLLLLLLLDEVRITESAMISSNRTNVSGIITLAVRHGLEVSAPFFFLPQFARARTWYMRDDLNQ